MSADGAPEHRNGTVTFMFTDIEGSTVLLKQLGRERYGELLGDERRVLRGVFTAHRGEEVDTQGDAFFVAFHSAQDAVSAAVDAQRALAAEAWPDGAEVRVRIGIHSGEAAAADEHYVGFSVHRAARIGAAAHGGQTLVSSSTRELVEDDLPAGISLRDLGLYRLKDVDRPERISQLASEGLQAEFPVLRGAEPVKAQPLLRRRSSWAVLAGLIAAAVAIPVFVLGGSTPFDRHASIASDSIASFDASGGKVTGQAPVGFEPGAIAAGDHAVWVANLGGNSVSRIDPRTHARVQTIQVGSSPSAIAVGDGFVWVANSLSGSVWKIDPNANGGTGAVVDKFDVGNGPTGVAWGDGRLWVANSTDRTVMELAPDSHKLVRTIPMAEGADAVAFGFALVWVVNSGGNSVTRIDPRSGTPLPPVGVGNDPRAIAIGSDAVWVANSLDGTVSRITRDGGAVTVITVGGAPSSIAAGTGAVWVGDGQVGKLTRIDPQTRRPAGIVTLSNRLAGVSLAQNTLYAAVRASAGAHRGGKLTLLTQPGLGLVGFGSMDPATVYDSLVWQASILLNDGLVTFQRVGGSDGGRIVPDLATSLPTITDGGRTYTFQVRPGIHYSTGALVQPADFRRGIERTIALWHAAPASAPTSGLYFTGLVGADACTKTRCDLSRGIVADQATRTVTFHLRAPDPDFLYKLTAPSASAVPVDTPIHAHLPLPATGPYRIAKYTPKRRLVLVRNPRFHEWSAAAQPNGYPNRIVWKLGDTSRPAVAAAQFRAVRTNKADYTSAVGLPATIHSLGKAGYSGRLYVNPVPELSYLFFNTRLAPFDNVDARRAVSLAVNRAELARRVPFPATPTCQVLPPNVAGHVRYCPYEPNLAKAQRLVARSGTRGQQVTFWSGPGGAQAAAYVVSVLKKLGYKARLRTVPEAKVGTLGANSRVQIALSYGWWADYPSADDFFHPLLTCRSFRPRAKDYANYAQFCDPRVDAAIRRARAAQTNDPQAAATLWSKVDHDVVDQAPWVPFGNLTYVDFVSRRVGNYQYNPHWMMLVDQLWVR